MIYRFFEHIEEEDTEDIKKNDNIRYKPLGSFSIKDHLAKSVWENDDVIREGVREQLLTIATDFYQGLELGVEMEDIILTGSLANYNHSEYSDFDLHILMDFSKVNKDYIIMRKYADSVGAIWNLQHEIEIEKFEVEIYLQDISEEHASTGQYSLLNNIWNVKPDRQTFEPDENLIKIKSKSIMDRIDEIDKEHKSGSEYEGLIIKIKRIFKKIKDGRKAGLLREGEFSIENLVFKLLRRNGYIEKIINVRREAYDSKFN
jgi:hypothetical protein